ncbi:ABC transporter ATP-binding protein [Anaerovibrio slackiae]|uniref:ABC transporter ATP-binding protein n=1 Tax=Anaerovibrio slackiae TaxID=2652309 RepID=UPI00386B4245
MSEDWAIKIEHLSKVYKIFDKPMDRVKEALNPFRKRYSRDFYALNDVSLTIKKGETVGIIGKNGAGKSTILKIITGVLTPTSGSVQVNGRIASLLELGAGFNPEMTGVENIYMNGTIMGYSKEEMDERLQDIVDFADIGDFIHQPVKMYSSGMFARLAFAVNASLEPDVLIVDEALSVGDFMFQFKCMQRFKELQKKGVTVLYVTHNTQEVISTCDRAIFFHEGCLQFESSDVEYVVYKYAKCVRDLGEQDEPNESNNDVVLTNADVNENRFGSSEAIIKDIVFDSPNGMLEAGKLVNGKIIIEAKKNIDSIVFGFSVKNKNGDVIWGDNTTRIKGDIKLKEGENVIAFSTAINIVPGEYLLYAGIADISGANRIELDQRWPMKKLKVFSQKNVPEGMVYAPVSFFVE